MIDWGYSNPFWRTVKLYFSIISAELCVKLGLKQYRITGYDLIIVNCSKMPDDINEVRKYLGQFIVLD